MNWRDPIESNGIVRTGTQLISKFPSYSRSYEAETAHIMALDMCLANDIGLKKIKNMRNARVFSDKGVLCVVRGGQLEFCSSCF